MDHLRIITGTLEGGFEIDFKQAVKEGYVVIPGTWATQYEYGFLHIRVLMVLYQFRETYGVK